MFLITKSAYYNDYWRLLKNLLLKVILNCQNISQYYGFNQINAALVPLVHCKYTPYFIQQGEVFISAFTSK